ncbi:hypothetical protein BVI434_180055 [Burkholderia vietnamiensis]|nr:hypothetical protein BVI434_180055 [Burkholderia vietnamiensis]
MRSVRGWLRWARGQGPLLYGAERRRVRRACLFDSEIVTSSDPLNGTPDRTDVTHANRANPVAFGAWRPAH